MKEAAAGQLTCRAGDTLRCMARESVASLHAAFYTLSSHAPAHFLVCNSGLLPHLLSTSRAGARGPGPFIPSTLCPFPALAHQLRQAKQCTTSSRTKE